MDLARDSKSSFKVNKIIKFLMYLPGLWLTFHIIRLAFNEYSVTDSSQTIWTGTQSAYLMEEYKYYRNIFYTTYVVLFLLIGVYVVLRSGQKILLKKEFNSTNVSQIVPNLTTSLIFVTFSYAIVGLLMDIYRFVMEII